MQTPGQGNDADRPFAELPRTELVRLLQLTLNTLGSLHNSGLFKPMESNPEKGARQYGSLSLVEARGLYVLAYRHVTVEKEMGDGMTDRQLALTLQHSLEALGALFVQSKFRPMDPDLAKAAARYGIESAEQMEEILLLMLRHLTKATQSIGGLPPDEVP